MSRKTEKVACRGILTRFYFYEFRGGRSFSTATPDCNTYQSNVPERFSLRPRSGHWWPSKSQSCPRQLRAIETIFVIVHVLEYKRSGTPWPGKDVLSTRKPFSQPSAKAGRWCPSEEDKQFTLRVMWLMRCLSYKQER